MVGVVTPAAVLMVDFGPLPLAPAQVVQLSQPDILCICDFTVWADRRRDAADRVNSAITRMAKVFVLFVTITNFYSRGLFLFSAAITATKVEINDASTLLQPFSARILRKSKCRTTR